MSIDAAQTGNLQALLSQIGAGLDDYLKFEHPDPLHPVRLAEDLEGGTISRSNAARFLHLVMQAVLAQMLEVGANGAQAQFSKQVRFRYRDGVVKYEYRSKDQRKVSVYPA